MIFISRQNKFIDFIQAFRLFNIVLPFKSFKYLIGNDSFYIILEFDSLPQNISYLYKNFYLIDHSDIEDFLKSYHVSSLIHVDRNKNILDIHGFVNYYDLFITNLNINQSNLNLELLKEVQELHLKFFCADFINISLEASEGDFIIFNILGSDCFIKRFLEFLPKHISENLKTTWEKDYEQSTVEFLDYLMVFMEFEIRYVLKYDCFLILNLKWIK